MTEGAWKSFGCKVEDEVTVPSSKAVIKKEE